MRRVSLKRQRQMREELPIRKLLCERAGGRWEDGHCKGGLCENPECGKPPDFRGLHPHELVLRSRGGRLSLDNSVMWCGRCHSVKGHNLREA